jgi:hypothetical protein
MPKGDAPAMEHIPFNKSVDPNSVLEEMMKAGYVHGEDNKVQY